ncbi:MAG TPA: hypothetical protein VFN22_06925 [Gemmatimonadales bacterium]|nr:hypothetical protein [Gemmatimonadales bacterium]
MTRLLWLIGSTVRGAVGWWAGSVLGIWGSVMLGVVGTAAGVYWARQYARNNF